ncbi:MAG: UDP-N-acetylglucosamine 2-epimerase (hydrolyzing) [Gammaproteobacteria bacterium]|nr:UDP-N-acetylglucosamine 2-epimerase (hydrolyzing) [Gammaproteobacteria bacterium]
MKKILALTGTRADFGKLKPILNKLDQCPEFELLLFVTGMHLLTRYGRTLQEVQLEGYHNIYTHINQNQADTMDSVLAKTIGGLSDYVKEGEPDLIIVHGDRVEALAGAIVGSMNNILVMHIEGGEVSGTIDDSIRHAITKLAHIHLVANREAQLRLIQLGEDSRNIHIVGSPDIDIMLSDRLPSLKQVRQRYSIAFERYSILLFHSVTTETADFKSYMENLIASVRESGDRFVVIYPNNDLGSESIFDAYASFSNNPRIRLFPSMRFEYFLTLLRHADYIIGNSSAGIREAPIYGVPAVNIGTRQQNRATSASVHSCGYGKEQILNSIGAARESPRPEQDYSFGRGDSVKLIMEQFEQESLWETDRQKRFVDLPRAKSKAPKNRVTSLRARSA